MRLLYEPVFYPEGPAWDAGRLYFVEYARHAVGVIDPTHPEPQTVWQRPGFGPAAVACAPDGSLWVTGSDADCVAHIERDGTLRDMLRTDGDGRPFPAPNDLVFDGSGALYFTASGVFDPTAPVGGCVVRHTPGGDSRVLADAIHYANGIALAPDGTTLFVSEHFGNRVLAFDVRADGTLAGRRVYADLHTLAPLDIHEPLLGPDGIACTPDGTLLIAHFGGARLLAVAPDARLQGIIPLPFQFPTNVTFGDTARTAYVTAFGANAPPYAGAILELDIPAHAG